MSKKIMEKYSNTFYVVTQEFPDDIKEDIYKLYAYLRICDEMAEGEELYNYNEWMKAIHDFNLISDKYQFEESWIKDFHNSMFTDLVKKKHTIVSMLDYTKGSSEAVGLMMARLLGCPPEADPYARSLGRAYQIINFVRDYEEDVAKGYHYIGEKHDLYIRMFMESLDEGMKGIEFIPEHLRLPIKLANQKYMEVASQHKE
jgi:phytoene synthase